MTSPNFQGEFVKNVRDFFFAFEPTNPTALSSQTTVLPLVCNSGFLLLDSGEVDPSFVYRCQDRYFVYTSMVGLRSLFFVASDRHFELYVQLIEQLRQRFRAASPWQEMWENLVLPTPCFVPCDAHRGEIPLTPLLVQQIQRPEVRESLLTLGLRCNQISPALTQLWRQWLQHIHSGGLGWDGSGGIDLEHCDHAGQLALRFHDKSAYVQLVKAIAPEELPPHTPTLVLTVDELSRLPTWEALYQRFKAATHHTIEPTAFYAKSSFDSGGNAATILNHTGYAQQQSAFLQELSGTQSLMDMGYCRRELRAAIAAQPTLAALLWSDTTVNNYATAWVNQRRQSSLMVLVQPQLKPTTQHPNRPHGIGYSVSIAPTGACQIIAVAAQVYADPNYKHHLGSWLSTELTQQITTLIPFASVHRLAQQFFQEGYCGPISFDAILNEAGQYEFIYDCNPRLTAIFPSLAVWNFLSQQGFAIESVFNLDYRGRYQLSNPETSVQLAERGWLFTPQNPSGLIYIPNLAKESGFDIVMVNMTLAEMNAVVVSGLLGDGQDDDKGIIQRLYC